MWIKWDKELISSTPTIVPSETISSELLKIGKNVFTVPNFPLKSEIEHIGKPEFHPNFSSIYAGVAPTDGIQPPSRNIEGFTTLFEKNDVGTLKIVGWKTSSRSNNIKYYGFLDRKKMFSVMFESSIGIIPWKKHSFHYYCSPNKAYEYAHAGLLVFSTSSLKPIFDELKDNAIGFEDYNEMIYQLEYYKTVPEELYSKRLKIYEFSRQHILWENHEKFIAEAYKLA
ncbi:MAG: hypothetical protein H0X03_06970 [Nitrosopumilus sp.]|nr:hypothetical protein [Nitrosopumilus sp.]